MCIRDRVNVPHDLGSRPRLRGYWPLRVQVEDGETYRRQDSGNNPESDYDLGFRPVFELKVMMYGRHQENPPAEDLEAHHLNHHAHGLNNEYSTDDKDRVPCPLLPQIRPAPHQALESPCLP